MLIYIFVFSLVLRIRLRPMETGTDSFAIYLLAGLLPWMAFSEALAQATGVFQGKANLITRVVFPLEILPMASVLVPFFLNGLGFALYLGYLIIKGYTHIAWLWLPAVIGVHIVFTLGLVILISSLSVFVRDIQQAMGIILSLWLYLTPIIYPIAMVPERFISIIRLNPMYPFIELYHRILLQHSFSWGLFGYAGLLAILSFSGSTLFFGRAKYAFADVL
jgi:lipopolysaccharide transport system permease protein